ncbi:MAG: cell surface protein, partial [Pirellulales bacterium]|nr:cell surface protein [Pirellulales bacterium]
MASEKLAKIEGNRIVPLADGETELICNYGATEIRVPVKVSRSQEKLPISFERDIVPIMTRSGCNTGSCHGAARGKDGFMISLFGYDPAGDYKRITREIGMRRINLAVPQESLFLTKATGKVTHSGGK